MISSTLRPGSKSFTGENNLLVIFIKVNMAMEPDLADSYVLTSWPQLFICWITLSTG